MAGSVPEVIRNNPEKAIATSFTDKVDLLLGRRNALGLTAMIVQEALEYDTEAKRLAQQAEKKRNELKAPILEAERRHDAYWKGEIIKPINDKRQALQDHILLPWNRIQRRKALEQARIEAERARQAAAARRQAELAMLEAEGAQEAAQELAAQPVTVITTPVEPPKLEGATVVRKKVGKVTGPAGMLDLLVYLLGIQKSAVSVDGYSLTPKFDLINELIEFSQSGLNAAIKRGLVLPGVEVSEVEEFRNTSRS